MIKKLFFLIGLLAAFHARSQVIVTLQLPPLGLTIKPQLWNLSLVNTSGATINVKIEVIMTDASNNQQVMTGISNTVVLPVGVRQLTVNDLQPIAYNVTGTNYNIDASPSGFLPVGNFHFCYIVTKVATDAPERMGEECETVEIEPLSPPQLLIPADSEHVELTRPFFTWIPPTPLNLFSNLNYSWTLVEVQPTQSAADAIQQNIPVLSQTGLLTTNFQYPPGMAGLDTGKAYAWRVTARNNTSVIANSEVWTFRVKKFNPATPAVGQTIYYTKLRREDDASYVIASGWLRFEYLNEINSNEVNVKIYDIGGAKRKEVTLDSSSLRIVYGQNFVDMDLREHSGIKDRQLYLLELVNAKGEKWYLKFEYRKPD